jgi:hypothetical protein
LKPWRHREPKGYTWAEIVHNGSLESPQLSCFSVLFTVSDEMSVSREFCPPLSLLLLYLSLASLIWLTVLSSSLHR